MFFCISLFSKKLLTASSSQSHEPYGSMYVCLEKNALFRCARHRAAVCGESPSHGHLAELEWVQLLWRQTTQAPDLCGPFLQAAYLSSVLRILVTIEVRGYHVYPRLPSFLPSLTLFWTTHGFQYVFEIAQ